MAHLVSKSEYFPLKIKDYFKISVYDKKQKKESR